MAMLVGNFGQNLEHYSSRSARLKDGHLGADTEPEE